MPGRGFAPSDTRSELDETIKGRNAISDFSTSALSPLLVAITFAWAKEIWDISAIAYLLDESYMLTEIPFQKPSQTERK